MMNNIVVPEEVPEFDLDEFNLSHVCVGIYQGVGDCGSKLVNFRCIFIMIKVCK